MLKKTLYEVLGVEKTATAKEIKKAYRDLSKSNHPDKMGSDSMQTEINNAHEVLSDPERRKRYDDTGIEKDPERNQKVQNFMGNIFFMLIEQVEDPGKVDLIYRMRKAISAMIDDSRGNIDQAKKQLKKYEKVIKKMKTVGDQNLIVLLNRQIDQITQNIKSEESHVEFVKEMLVLADDYSFDFEAEEAATPVSRFGDSYKDAFGNTKHTRDGKEGPGRSEPVFFTEDEIIKFFKGL